MCGIVGLMTGTYLRHHMKWLGDALYVDALRGMDSTGLAVVDKDNDVEVIKKSGSAESFLYSPSVENLMDIANHNKVMIGHNRAATRGKISTRNAHPFQVGPITLVHNGSLTSMTNLPNYNKFTVDSEAITHSIAEIGAEETIKLLNGSYTLVWYNSDTKKVYAVRNEDRPFSFASVENSNTVLFASEEPMLRWLAQRNKITLDTVYDLTPGNLIEFDPFSTDIINYNIKQVETYKHAWYGGKRNTNHNTHQSNNSKKTESKPPLSPRMDNQPKPSDTRDDRNQKMFEVVDVKEGDLLKFSLYDFTPFNQDRTDRGYYIGFTVEEPYVTVRIYGLDNNALDIGSTYHGLAKSMYNDSRSHAISIANSFDYHVIVDQHTLDQLTDSEGRELSTAKKEEPPFQKKQLPIALPEYTVDDLEGQETANIDFLYLMGPRGIAIPRKDWDDLTRHGCSMCQKTLDPSDAQLIRWAGEYRNQPICPSCAKDCEESMMASQYH